MTSNAYYIPGHMPLAGYLLQCPKCKRKILVEAALNGSNHNMSVVATCGDCIIPTEALKLSHPDVANKIEEWVKRVED